MTLNTVSNAQAVIADISRKTETQLSEIGAEALASILQSEGQFDRGGPITAHDDAGNEIDAETWFRAKLAAFPAFVVTPSKPKEAAPTGNLTERGLAHHAARRATNGKAETARKAAEAGNPWRSSTLNRTRQAIIQNNDPQLAEVLRAEAAL